MITNIILGTNNLNQAETFYDSLLSLFGAKQTKRNERSILWKSEEKGVGIAICTPHNKDPATHGNGTMVGLSADSVEKVTQVYEKALELGGSCAGKPGERVPGIHAAYFRDLDQNKFGVFFLEN